MAYLKIALNIRKMIETKAMNGLLKNSKFLKIKIKAC